jgi:hypothetical protein
MGVEGTTILWAMLAFQLKHFICDFFLQTQWQVQKKGIYGHLGGITHAGMHAIGSIPALLVMHADIRAMAILIAGEFIVHYHTDWAKAQLDRITAATVQDSLYWTLFGLDQLVHQITYIAMIYLAMRGFFN